MARSCPSRLLSTSSIPKCSPWAGADGTLRVSLRASNETRFRCGVSPYFCCCRSYRSWHSARVEWEHWLALQDNGVFGLRPMQEMNVLSNSTVRLHLPPIHLQSKQILCSARPACLDRVSSIPLSKS